MDARRYLKLQAELGGPEVYLRTGQLPGRGGGLSAPPPPLPPPAAPAPATGPEPSAPAASGAAQWRTNLPPIPGPGLAIAPPPGSLDHLDTLEAVSAAVAGCEQCLLCRERTNTVPGEGNPAARLMCVGEGPGETEDKTGRPFVGRAGELLSSILAAIELPREQVFIANVVKCRPPGNRKPTAGEMAACLPYLRRQIQLVRPKVLLALGATAAEGLLGSKGGLGTLRNLVHRFDGTPLIVTYHPAALLRNPNWKKPTWDDVRIARQLLDA